LTQNLGFPDNEGIQTRSDGKEVCHGLLIEKAIDMRLKV
jgi:hypothetical protein